MFAGEQKGKSEYPIYLSTYLPIYCSVGYTVCCNLLVPASGVRLEVFVYMYIYIYILRLARKRLPLPATTVQACLSVCLPALPYVGKSGDEGGATARGLRRSGGFAIIEDHSARRFCFLFLQAVNWRCRCRCRCRCRVFSLVFGSVCR